jgi:alpha-beta hydrolase superfamily lysophospholipase
MGALIALIVVIAHSPRIHAAAIWNTDASAGLSARAALAVLAWERFRLGSDIPSRLMPKLTFQAWNRQVGENRTPFDWLSRDTAVVDAYVADPSCGFTVGAPAVADMAAAAPRLADPTALAAIRKTLPLYVVAGDADPVNAGMALLELLVGRYRAAGLTNVTLRAYPGARHELFGEINRDEVTRDLLAWLHAKVPAPR